MSEREIGVEVSTTLNLPSVREMRFDVDKLGTHRTACQASIERLERQIENQKHEKAHLLKLVEDPVEDGIRYSPEACARAAEKCDVNVGMFNALIKKERAKVTQLSYMVGEIEKRIWLSEQMSQSTGS